MSMELNLPEVAAALALAILVIGLFVGRYRRRLDLSAFDSPDRAERFSSGAQPNAEHRAVVDRLAGIAVALKGAPRSRYLSIMRQYMDGMFADRVHSASFAPLDVDGIRGEWVSTPGADRSRRTLYIHGGAFTMGSPRSHRTVSAKFAEITGGVVLALDYRLMPEHSRQAGIDDCRAAYRWMLEHGPDGAQRAAIVFVAGDSAGGNLTLSLLAWIRDRGLRAPDAAVALSPATDSCFGSPSLKSNLATDVMLRPVLKKIVETPRIVLLAAIWLNGRIRPDDPLVSPIYGDLAGLPPLLIHASEVEMLLDDSRRYANKAIAAGSPVRLQTWNHVVHVWHLFDPSLSEARQAFEEIRTFLAEAIRAKAPGGGG